MPIFEGQLDATKLKLAIVVSRFNLPVTEGLLASALDGFLECGAGADKISIHWVPGAYEIPIVVKRLADSKKFDAIVTLGCIIRGETVHFELLANSCSSALQTIAVNSGVPVIFSILATETTAQAEERVDAGRSGALCAVEMANLLKSI